MNRELIKLKMWTVANKLTINVRKTNAIIFTKLNTPRNIDSPVKIDNEIVSTVSICKFLGVFIDERLSFDSHLKYITERLLKTSTDQLF